MALKVIMPQGGQDLTTGSVVSWWKKEGDPVMKGETICEVETEKATFEVAAPQDGILLKILVNAGEEAAVLSPIGYIGEEGEIISIEEDVVEEHPQKEDTHDGFSDKTVEQQSINREEFIISPKARKLAQEHGLTLDKIPPSGPGGKITTEDVMQAISGRSTAISSPHADSIDNGKLVEPNRVKLAAAQRLQQSWQTAPHIFVTVSVDMTEAGKFKLEHEKITFNDMIIRACTLALKQFPQINTSILNDGRWVQWEDLNIGIAVSTPQGLLVAVLEKADQLTVAEIAEKTKTAIQAARDGRLISASPSRFTISNLGMYQVDAFTAVINPPESAILAISTIRKQPVVNERDQVIVREMMNMTISMDHRIGDGVLAAQFINEVKRFLENPSLLK
jgi:pyruvate dehydrogenase E2 component (dihydrolipoamide acetyltransferase)